MIYLLCIYVFKFIKYIFNKIFNVNEKNIVVKMSSISH